MEQQKRRRKKKKPNFIAPVIIVIFSVIGIFLVYKAFNFAFDRGKVIMAESEGEIQLGEEIIVTIPEGASTGEIAKILKDSGLIDSEMMFKLNSKLGGFDGTYQQGDYLIAIGTSDEAIMELIQSGEVYKTAARVTIPEGFTVYQIADRLEAEGIVTAEEFLQAANQKDYDYEFLREVADRQQYLEGYLFPATYEFADGITPREIIVQMLNRYQISYNRIKDNNNTGYSDDEILIIASLIEKEIQVPEERAVAAGVIYNRLKQGMRLQIDSTVQYALQVYNEVVTLDDLTVESPYNTYEIAGIPVGPICNPGDAAIDAALYPDSNNYLYYVVKERGQGNHEFCETYEEFLEAKERYKDSF